MTKVTYEIVEHDGGWAYRFDGTYSETFRTHDDALAAAKIAAAEQQVAGRDRGHQLRGQGRPLAWRSG